MKKLFAFISILAVMATAAFAEVTAKKNADGSVEVTFFYGNPRASEVLLAGDFTNWQDGALPMEKGEKGFSLTKTFKATDVLTYKFISDGNWTTDLRAPEFVDDGFGGKNSRAELADLISSGDDAAAGKAKINFVSWTMFGVQGNYLTQGVNDKTEKGLDLDSVTIGFKSYDKFVGTFLPNAPLYIEVALAETDLEDYSAEKKIKYLYQKNGYDDETLEFTEGLKGLVSGIFSNPVSYFARTNNNGKDVASEGPGSNPFLGHLKFGWNTPYINFVTGFNYAKPDVRQAITWTTVCSSWDAGYQHVGGFNQFSIGDKAAAFLEEKTGLKFDIGFAPNKTGDRKGTKYGYWAWVGVSKDDLAIDFQSNGMYNGKYMFYEPVEHDFILGAKDTFAIGDGKLNVAAQALVATHQKTTAELVKANGIDNPKSTSPSVVDYFGYSTDAWYRDSDFDGLQNMAANVQAGYSTDLFSANVGYRMRGMQASMLYVRENHDDGTFDLSDQLGVLNSQAVSLDGSVNLLDGALGINLGVAAETALSELKAGDEEYDVWNAQCPSWWVSRKFINNDAPLFGIKGGAEFTFKPAVTYTLEDMGMTFGAYADMNYQAYDWSEGNNSKNNKYGCSDSAFRVKKAGVTFNMKPDSDVIKGIDVYYGFDLSNSVRWFNTLVGQVTFPGDLKANLAFGVKTENVLSADKSFDDSSDWNNPFAFAVGASKKFQSFQKPTVYAQFVYNMDPFKHFGDGQDGLNLNRANVNGSHEKEGVGVIDAVDWYDGRAALRCGIRWDI